MSTAAIFPDFPPSPEEYQGLLEEFAQCRKLLERTSEDQKAIASESLFYEEALEQLVQLSTQHFASGWEYIHALLALGQRLFQLETGILSQIEDQTYTIKSLVSPNELLAVGQSFDLKDTLCDFLIHRQETFFIPHISQSPQQQHPAHQNLHLESYVGAVVRKGGEIVGTLNFSSTQVMDPLFADKKIRILQLMADKIGKLLKQVELENQLIHSKQRYQTLFDAAPDMLASVDPETGTFRDVNQTMLNRLGYRAEELIGQPVKKIYQQESLEKVRLCLSSLKSKGTVEHMELEVQTKEGEVFPIELNANLVHEESGDAYSHSVLRDVREKKELQQQLSDNQQRLQDLNHRLTKIHLLSPGIIYLYSLSEQRNLFANRSIFSILGYSKEEIKELGPGFLFEILHPDDIPKVLEHHQKVLPYLKEGEEVELEYRIQRKEGKGYVWLLSIETGYQWNEQDEVEVALGLALDVTEKKAAEKALALANEELATTNEELRAIQEELMNQQHQTLQLNQQLRLQKELLQAGESISKTGTFEVNFKNRRVNASKGLLDIYELEKRGWDQAEFDLKIQQRTHPEDRSNVEEVIAWNQAHQDDLQPIIHRLELPSGQLKWVEVVTSPSPSRQPNELIGAVKDITAAKEAERNLQNAKEELMSSNEELRISQEELLSYQEQLQAKNHSLEEQKLLMTQGEEVAKLGAWILDANNLSTDFSDGFVKVHGLEEEEVRPMNALQLCLDRIHPNDKERVSEALQRLPEFELPFELVYQFLLPGKGTIWLRDTVGHRLPDGRFVGTSQNITLQKEQELELLSTQKELEQMIYSISHDLRAPIRHINGYSNMVLEESEGMEADQRNRLERGGQSFERLGNLIDELLEYSRGRRKTFSPQEVDVHQMVSNLVQPYELPATSWEVSDLPNIQADVDMLTRIFQNLIDNAVKFTRKKEQPHIAISASWQEKEKAWLFAVKDNGAGFDMRFASKLFAVFQRLHLHDEFPGTGIGLATVKRFVQMHGGRIWAQGVVNEGANFYFTIPQ